MRSRDSARAAALDQIRRNVALYGFHTHVIAGGGEPRYAYTIGLRQSLGAEVILAGAYYYLLNELPIIVKRIVAELKPPVAWDSRKVDLGSWGVFSFRKVHMSWAANLMLGALDFYQVGDIEAFQIVPDDAHFTVDIPNLGETRSPHAGPAWRELRDWPYPIPMKSVGKTNLAALRGERITEVARWEEDEWELFAGAGPDVSEDERRVVPLRVLLASDQSLIPIVNLPIGRGLWRDADSEWHPWGR